MTNVREEYLKQAFSTAGWIFVSYVPCNMLYDNIINYGFKFSHICAVPLIGVACFAGYVGGLLTGKAVADFCEYISPYEDNNIDLHGSSYHENID